MSWAVISVASSVQCEQSADRLVLVAPTVASQLMANLSYLVAAYLPDAGTHTIEPDVAPDIEDQST